MYDKYVLWMWTIRKSFFFKSNASKADLTGMFDEYKKLKKECIIAEDYKIIDEFIKEKEWGNKIKIDFKNIIKIISFFMW